LLAPAHFHNRSLADPHTWQAPAQNAALLEESIRIGLDPSEAQRRVPRNWYFGAAPTWNLSPCGTTDAQTALPVALHITGPSQCPLIDKPHTTSIAGTRPAVARRPRKVVTQVTGWCGIVPVSPTGTNGIFPGNSESVLSTESDFCGRARIQLAN
jgi:hypothetical protein